MTNAKKQFKDVELIQKIPSIALDRAIANMGGKESLYLSLITNFYHAQVNIKVTLTALHQEERWEQLYRVVHTLKTNTAYIGAFTLSEMCGQVEAMFEGKDYANKMFFTLVDQLGDLIDDLKNILNDEAQENIPTSQTTLGTMLQGLKPLLLRSSLDVETRLPALQAMTRNGRFEQDINVLVTLILNVEYEKALPLIDDILVKANDQ